MQPCGGDAPLAYPINNTAKDSRYTVTIWCRLPAAQMAWGKVHVACSESVGGVSIRRRSMMSSNMVPEWIRSKAKKADSLQGFAKLALAELAEMGGDTALVCGPISTGGLGNIEDNLGVFNATIASLRRTDPAVFDTLPFEAGIVDQRIAWESDTANTGKPFSTALMAQFYGPIFRFPGLTHAYFIPGWEASFGATMQRGMLIALNRRIVDLPADWSRTFRLG
jgi:hypothetical protein